MTNKEKYASFVKKTYVPIYSQLWWMDAVCGEDNWDVLLYKEADEVMAAMPYYVEKRGEYRYITKALLTQNNGIIFNYPAGVKEIGKAIYEERVVDFFCSEIEKLKVDVYEQQYQYTFHNYLPFYWNGYKAIPRYTYVIPDGIDIDCVWDNLSSKARKCIKKGNRNASYSEEIDVNSFYAEHEKVFKKQDLQCPFSYNFWITLYNACVANNSGKIVCMKDADKHITSLMFLVWDEKTVYLLLGGSMPEYQNLDTYSALIWEGIKYAVAHNKKFDFEGSMIKRISKAFREFGGIPMLYFRIRKIFNENIPE